VKVSTDQKQQSLRVLISGGGTGGHVFPAIAIADAIRALSPEASIRFVGAKGKIEMEKVPQAGYPIDGLWISGFQRSLSLRNLLFPVKLMLSLWKAYRLVQRFKPQLVIGVGGYASGPVLEVATRLRIPTLIQEQNSYAGVTNRLLAHKVSKICVAYPGMERFFPADRIIFTGNPVRKDILANEADKATAAAEFRLNPEMLTIFISGGSLGALSLNEAMEASATLISSHPDIQIIWQSGKAYHERFAACATASLPNVRLLPFISRMDLAYTLADVVISRAGALTISELCLAGKAAVLIPSPNVAEDHQTQNARSLADKDAAVLIPNDQARNDMMKTAISLLHDPEARQRLSKNIKLLARPDAARDIALEAINLISHT
jgi:UDP-N-acetylglucosamine--N-acetylmuramyl-(pentapeptide) pyrophosphoryl-undecaprenol N-acetylglucosamine transferase